MTPRIIHLIDRSRVVAREECVRLRYLSYDYAGTGLDTEAGSLPLINGIAIHAAHARLLGGMTIEEVIATFKTEYTAEVTKRGLVGVECVQEVMREQLALLEGMLRMWAHIRLPMLLAEYDVVSIEKAMDWELAPGLVMRMRFDAVLRRKDDGMLFILDYKTVGYPSEVWESKFDHDMQTCLYLLALKEKSGEAVGGMLYEGLVKGQFKKETAKSSPFTGQKIQMSPYTLCYALKDDVGAIYQVEYTPRKGWKKVHSYDEMPIATWVDDYLLPEVNAGRLHLFIVVPPVCPPDYELARVKAQVVREELAYLDGVASYRDVLALEEAIGAPGSLAEDTLNIVAPLRTGRCWKYGLDYKCKFIDICFNEGADPLADGYIPRKPHHDTDLEMVA